MLDGLGWVLVVDMGGEVRQLLLLLLELVEDGESGGVLEVDVIYNLVEWIRRKLGEGGEGVGVHPLRRRRAGTGGRCRGGSMPLHAGGMGVVAVAVAGARPLVLLITASHLGGGLGAKRWRRRRREGRGGARRQVGAVAAL